MPEKTLLNHSRPPIFCPGCSHDQVLRSLDKAFLNLGLAGHQICMVSDIGCSGFFDVFFNTHAMHGVHGRALTYAAGIKLCQPELNVVVTMGDGGLGIGAAHVIAACRRNLDLTLLVLNNYNFGMTGGQYSATTPNEAVVGSGFLNKLDKPLDLPALAAAAGAPFVCRCSTYQKDLTETLERAITYKGFSVVEIHGICPGRFTKRNKITPQSIAQDLAAKEQVCGEVAANQRQEYGLAYGREAAAQPALPRPLGIEPLCQAPQQTRQEVVILGAAGQRIITAGEVLALAGLAAGLHASQKNEYNVTVLRGPSISDLILSPEPIAYNGAQRPSVVIALSHEGVERRRGGFAGLGPEVLILQAPGVELPPSAGRVLAMDFKGMGIKAADWALASLAVLARQNQVLNQQMLVAALEARFQDKTLAAVKETLARVAS
ncbi:MAG: 2-oxoglutarate synthase [Desulfarculus sp.]|nr:MAG: 2-oxoglutarate synthase [Desulfarculus sp.]